MGFAARQELAGWFRRWVLRIMRLARPLAQAIPEVPDGQKVAALLAAVSASETKTTGIIEQRVVDAVAASLHDIADGWRANGIGDSVNASNVSRRKLGDCEFQNTGSRSLVAYEAHGGHLSEVYINGHVQTLRRVVPLRVEEWERVKDLDKWTFEVVFVAHSFDAQARDIEVNGAVIHLRFETFAEFTSHSDASKLTNLFTLHVNAPLNERRTPQRVRDTYLALAMPQAPGKAVP